MLLPHQGKSDHGERQNESVTVHPVSAEAYGAKALRPKNSRLSKRSLDAGGFARLPEWEASLARLLEKRY